MNKPASILRVIGMVIFVAAFFLPGIAGDRDSFSKLGPMGLAAGGFTLSEGDLFHTGVLTGWYCAEQALVDPFDKQSNYDRPIGRLLVFVSGCLNIIVLLYLALCFLLRLWLLRRVAAIAILVCLVDTWIYFLQAGVYPLIGHDLWALGAILIVSAEAFRFRGVTDKIRAA
jgi:hypothetical protein